MARDHCLAVYKFPRARTRRFLPTTNMCLGFNLPRIFAMRLLAGRDLHFLHKRPAAQNGNEQGLITTQHYQ